MADKKMPEYWNKEIRDLAALITRLVRRAETIRDERARLISLASNASKGGRPKKADQAGAKERKAADKDVVQEGWQRSEANLRRLNADAQTFSGRVGTARNQLARSGGAEVLPEIDDLMGKLGSENYKLQQVVQTINGQVLPEKKK